MFTPSEIDQLPIGLIVRHLPAKVQATRGGVDKKHYRWEYRTAVSAMADSTILGFAAWRWDGERWVPRNPAGTFFTTGDFAEWYLAPGGNVGAGEERADGANFCTHTGAAVGYDEAGVKWLDGYVIRNHGHLKDNDDAISARAFVDFLVQELNRAFAPPPSGGS